CDRVHRRHVCRSVRSAPRQVVRQCVSSHCGCRQSQRQEAIQMKSSARLSRCKQGIREVEEDTTSPNHRLAHRLLALALVGHTWPEVPQPFAWPTVARPLGRYWPGQQAAAKLQSWSLSFHSRHSFNAIYVMQPHTYLRFFCAGVFVFLRCLLVGERRQPIHEFTRGCSKCEQVKATEVQIRCRTMR